MNAERTHPLTGVEIYNRLRDIREGLLYGLGAERTSPNPLGDDLHARLKRLQMGAHDAEDAIYHLMGLLERVSVR